MPPEVQTCVNCNVRRTKLATGRLLYPSGVDHHNCSQAKYGFGHVWAEVNSWAERLLMEQDLEWGG